MSKIPLEDILRAGHDLKGIVKNHPLELNSVLSERYQLPSLFKAGRFTNRTFF